MWGNIGAVKDEERRAAKWAAQQKAMGKRIRVERERKGMAKRALAKYAGFDVSSMGRVEDGEQGLSLESLMAIAEALEATLDYLANGRGEIPPGTPAKPEDRDQRLKRAQA